MQQLEFSDFNSADESRCPTCSRDDFKSQKGMRMHHARVHGDSLRFHEVVCEWCGSTTEVEEQQLENDRNFCDVGCKTSWESENKRGKDHHSWKERLTLRCEWCGDEFEVQPNRSDQRFCGIGCKSEWMGETFSGENAPRYNGGKEVRECRWCGDVFECWPSDNWKSCSRECYEAWYSATLWGQNNSHWRGGESMINAVRKLVGPGRWEIAKAENEEGSRGVCEMCGAEEIEHSHHNHHIVPIIAGGDHHQENLMLLCLSCHKTVELYTHNFTDPILLD